MRFARDMSVIGAKNWNQSPPLGTSLVSWPVYLGKLTCLLRLDPLDFQRKPGIMVLSPTCVRYPRNGCRTNVSQKLVASGPRPTAE